MRKNPEERSSLSPSSGKFSFAEFCPNPGEESKQQGNV
jgi:hypothetical protein